MKLFTAICLALTLTACGSDSELSDDQKKSAIIVAEPAEGTPDLRGWQIFPNATDSCFQVDRQNVHCMTEFTMDVIKKNCQDTTIKFIVKKGGYMYVQTLEQVIVRQGEPHRIEFTGEAEIFNINDELINEMYHAFRCFGQNGEVVKL